VAELVRLSERVIKMRDVPHGRTPVNRPFLRPGYFLLKFAVTVSGPAMVTVVFLLDELATLPVQFLKL
jgi:hypothetical protein